MEKQADIELRSEKLRNIIGRVPPALVRMGTVVTALATIAIAIALCLVPWPMTIRVEGRVAEAHDGGGAEVVCLVPYKYRYLFNAAYAANVTYEGMSTSSVCGKVARVDGNIVRIKDGNFFTISVSCINGEGPIAAVEGEKADVEIIVSNKTVWQQLRGR